MSHGHMEPNSRKKREVPKTFKFGAYLVLAGIVLGIVIAAGTTAMMQLCEGCFTDQYVILCFSDFCMIAY